MSDKLPIAKIKANDLSFKCPCCGISLGKFVDGGKDRMPNMPVNLSIPRWRRPDAGLSCPSCKSRFVLELECK